MSRDGTVRPSMLERVRDRVASWVPELAGFREIGSECGWTTYEAKGRFGSLCRVGVLACGLDPRPASDAVCLECDEIRGGFGKWDLVGWWWRSSDRVQLVRFEPLGWALRAHEGEWKAQHRFEEGVKDHAGQYRVVGRLWVPMVELRAGMAPFWKRRGGVEIYGDHRFCRLPSCNQTAFYPCEPGTPIWCWRHYQESLGEPWLAHRTDTTVRSRGRAIGR